jgi:hypothetical protein
MRKITFALLSMFFILPCMANIHINPDAVTEVVAKHFPNKQVECIREYNTQLKASNGSGIAASKLWNVCAAGGLDIKQPADKEKCRKFVNDLTRKGTVKFYAACGKDKATSGAVCVNDFSALTVNMQQAQSLAKLYARSKSDNTIQCRTKPRIESTTATSIDIHAMGMSSTTNTPYVQCTSYNSNKFYEFRFNSVDGNIDATNHKNFKTGICKIFGYKYVSKKPEAPADNHQFDICDGIKDESDCGKLDQIISSADVGYIASWGPLGYKTSRMGYQITSRNFPYCVLSENVAKGNDGYLLFERTAFGLDGRVFLKAGIQRKGSNEIKKQIRTYVENTMGKENVKSFSCEDTYHTIKLKDRSGKDDMLRCTVNDQVVEFFFDDLSEAWGVYDKSGREAMNCIAWGGTFTGKKCIGLDEKMCNTVRDANAQSCPECKLIKWNPNTETCDLPSSANATSLKRGLTYSAIVGGAVVSVVITVGSLGTATAPTVLVLTGLAVETMGSVIELKAQHAIYSKTDEFFEKANKCHNQTCAEKIIKEYLQALSNQQNDMQESEISAADKIFADLFDKIPANSKFYKDIIEQGMQGKTIASNKRGFFDSKSWNPEQIWRAVGVALQIIPTITSVGWRIAKKSDKLVNSTAKLRSKLDDASKYIDDALGIKKTANIDVISKQVDDLISQRNALYKQQSELLEQYRFADVSSEEELTRFLAQHPDIEAINKSLDDVSQQIQNIRYANPELWKPGEDVANYYDVEALQKRLKDIADEDAAYISELERKRAELSRIPEGVNVHTNEVSDEIKRLRDQQRMLVDESLKTQGLSYDDIRNVGKEEMDALEQSLRSKDSELAALYEDMRQARSKDYSTWSKAYDKYEDRLKQYSEYNDLDAKISSERKNLDVQSWKARKVIEKENPDVATLNKQIDDLDHTYSPEYEAYLNEQEYVNELLKDAKKTVGDKQNLAWWDAVPQAIKDKYVQYMDDTMIKALASDSDLSYYIKNWDYVKDNSQLYEEFLQHVERKLNTSVLPETKGVKISTYNDPNTSTMGYHGFGGQVGMNTHYYMGDNVDKTVSTVKHEILGHHVDDVAPNYGLQGETMRNFISENNDGFAKLSSHGNSDAQLTIAKSPILGTEFDVAGASDATKEALRNDGWRVFEKYDPDSYARYRAEMTEREAWLITPTSDVQDKVDAARKTFGLPEMPKFNPEAASTAQ